MILDILNQLAATTKRTEKEEILKDHKNNKLLKRVFWATYNSDLTYWIKKTPGVKNHDAKMTLDDGLSLILEQIATRKITGYSAIEMYQYILGLLSEDDAEVLCRIIARDLRCGVNTPTINKIWEGLIPEYKLMLAETDPKKLVFPCYIQTKFDGMRCLVTRTLDDQIIMRTRNGNQISTLEVMTDDFKKVIQQGETWDGELVCLTEHRKPAARKVSNGILNKAIRGTISSAEADLVTFQCWDIVDQTQRVSYRERLELLYRRFDSESITKVHPVSTKTAHSMEDIEKWFAYALEQGEEGIIAKNIESVWQPKRTFDLVKFKDEKTADLVVVGWEEGIGKNVGRLGALICESADGQVRVNVGTGFSDAQRDELTQNKPIDQIVEVKYNSRISSKGKDQDSLYLSRFIRFRSGEKDVADLSDSIK